MKLILPLFLALAASSLTLTAQENPAIPAAASADADALWTQVEVLFQQPSEKPKDPKNRDEMMDIYKRHLQALDAKTSDFLKAFPNDPRRWQISLHALRTNSVRTATGASPKTKAELDGIIKSILTAPDADSETQGMASFMNAMNHRSDPADFRTAAEAHLKAFPDFSGNKGITREIASLDAKEKLKADLAKAPLDLKFTATNGTEIDMANLRGKVVLIDFWATWCGPCIGEIPNVVATYNKLHDKGFEILGISFDKEKDKLDALTKDKNMPWPQYFDGKGWQNEFGEKFGIKSIPTMWLVDKNGMVVDIEARAGLEEKVSKLLDQPAP